MLLLGRAPAKLNLALELTGRRSDGFHQLAAISQTIDWSDIVALEADSGLAGGDFPTPELQVWGPEAHRVPAGQANIAVRAALLLRERGLGVPVRRLGLEKRVPPQSGLGGGSADAAAVLRLAGEGASATQLNSIALQCGADVPFGLHGGAARIGGVGEQLFTLPSLTRGAFLVVVLSAVATAAAYAVTDPGEFSDGSRVQRLAAALEEDGPLDPSLFGSALQPAALRAVPQLAARLATLVEAAPDARWAMTGTGGAFFSYLANATTAASLALAVAPACPGAGIRVALPLAPQTQPD